MHWVTGGERWRAWLVDHSTRRSPSDRVARRSLSPGRRAPQSNLRLESVRSPLGRVALSERVAQTVTERHTIDR